MSNLIDLNGNEMKNNNNTEGDSKNVLQINANIFNMEPAYFYCKNCREIETLANISLTAGCIAYDNATEKDLDSIAKRLAINIPTIDIKLHCSNCDTEMSNIHPVYAVVMKAFEDKGYIIGNIGRGEILEGNNTPDPLFFIGFESNIVFNSIPNEEYWSCSSDKYNDGSSDNMYMQIDMKHRSDFGLVAGEDEFFRKCITELFVWLETLPNITEEDK